MIKKTTEFEEWFETDKLIDKLNTSYTNNMCSGLTWDTIIEVSEYTWKKTLEWALTNEYVDEYGDDLINSQDIKEELENLNQGDSKSNNSS